MKIPLTLNGEKIILDCKADEPLIEILRKRGLFSVKNGCGKGICGSCTVLLDGKAVSSCKIPVGIVRDSKIETLEHFEKNPAYDDIISGFNKAGISLCGFCNAARILLTHDLISHVYRPTKDQLDHVAASVKCSCTEKGIFENGILYAVANKHSREGRK